MSTEFKSKHKSTVKPFDDSYASRASFCIAQGALTNSKRPESFIGGVYPTHLAKGYGCMVEDPKGNKYVDYICGLGTNLIGYGDSLITVGAVKALVEGSCLSLSSVMELTYAEKIKEIFPGIEMMKILKTGTEAAMAALRIARAYTGRKHVLSDGYHGHGDEFISLTPPHMGVNESSFIEKLNTLDQINGDVAAVIIEPIKTDYSPTRIKFLVQLKAKCAQKGVVLIFDEIITGFRWPQFCVSNFYQIQPDLILLGKAAGNGFPISIVGGKKEIMEGAEYFVSSTFAGDRVAMAASLEVIKLLQTKNRLEFLWDKGFDFCQSFNGVAKDIVTLEGYPTRGIFTGDVKKKALFFQESVKAGILFGPSWFFNFPLVGKTEEVIHALRDIFYKIKNNMVKLEGAMPVSPFAQKVREEPSDL